MIHVVVTLPIHPRRIGAFLALAGDHQEASLAERGCLRFDLLRDLADPCRFLLLEEWRDRAAIREHQRTPHYARWRREVTLYLTAPREHHEYECLDGHTGARIVFTNGCFDLLHAGHLHLLSEARAQGDRLVVGLNSDASVRRLKGPGRPVQTAATRAAVLRGLACVDDVHEFDTEDDLLRLVRRIAPDVLVKGAEYRHTVPPGAEYARRVHFVEVLPGHSTTGLVSRLRLAV